MGELDARTRSAGALILAAAAGGHIHAVQRLLRDAPPGALRVTNRQGATALSAALEAGHAAVVEALLAAGAGMD